MKQKISVLLTSVAIAALAQAQDDNAAQEAAAQAPAGQPGGTALHRPRLRALLRAHSYRRTRREPVVHHRSPPAHRLRPRTDRTGLAGPVPRQLRGHRRRPLADPARHGPERPGLLVRTEHTGRRSGAITMNRTAPAPTASTVGLECRHQFTSHFVPTGHPPTLRSPP